jgi:uncharacterized protein DUF6701
MIFVGTVLRVLGLVAMLLPGLCFAVTCTSTSNGAWTSQATWGGAGGGCGASGPVAGDTVVVSNTDAVTIAAGVTAQAASLQIGTNANGAASLTLSAASSVLNIAGNVLIVNSGNGTNVDALNVDAGTATMGSLTFDNSLGTGRRVRLRITSGTATVTGGVTFNAVNANVDILFVGAGTLNIGGDLPSGGTLTAATGTVNFNGAGAQNVGAYTYSNLSVTKSSGTATLLNTVSVGGNLSVTCPATCTDGTLDLSTFTANRSSGGGTLTVGSGATLKIGGTQTFPTNYGTLTLTGSTVDYSGTAQTVQVNSPQAVTYTNLTLSGSGTKTLQASALTLAGTGNFTMSGTAVATATATITVPGSFTLGSGTTFSGATFTHDVAGDFSNNGATFNGDTSTFNLNGASAQTIGGSASTTFNNLTISSSAGVTIGRDTTVAGAAAGALTLGTKILTTNANTLTLSGACNVATVSRTTGWVNGFLKKAVPLGTPTCAYEVGDASNYRPMSQTFSSVSFAGSVTGSVSSASGDHPNISTSLIDSLKNVNRYWTLTNSGVTFTDFALTLNFIAGDVDSAATSPTDLTPLFEIERWNGTSWATTTADPPNANPTNTRATGITAMSDFGVGRKKAKNFVISVPVAGDTCNAASVTITAKDSRDLTMTDYTGTMNLSTSTADGNWSTAATGTFNNGAADDGAASYAFVAADAGVVTLSLADIKINSDVTVTAVDSDSAPSSTTSAAIPFRGNLFTIASDTIQVAGKNQAMSVTRKQGASCNVTLGEYAGNKDLKAWYTADTDHPAGALAPSITGLGSPPLGTAVPGANNLTLTFAAGVANFTLTTTDVGKYGINLRDDATGNVDGTSSTITTRPFALLVTAIKQGATNNPAVDTAGGTKFAKAGTSFQATVASYLWNAAADGNSDGVPDGGASLANITASGTTPAYKWPTTLSAASPFTPAVGTDGTLGGGSLVPGDFASGSATPAALTYSEVGSFTLAASASNFLNSGITLTAIVFDNAVTPARNAVVGRFTPDHFTVAGAPAPTLTNRSGLSCAPASTFSYMGEGMDITFTLEAHQFPSGITTKYTTASSFAKLDLTSPANLNFGAKNGATNLTTRVSTVTSAGTWTGGSASVTGTLGIARLAAPDAPLTTVQFGIAPVDTDAVAMGAFDLDVDSDTVNDHTIVGPTTEVRFGRLRFVSATGTATVNLRAGIRTEYWNGSGFVTNAADNCTTLDRTNISLGSYAKSLNACETRSINATLGATISFSSGVGGLYLEKPGAANVGSVLLTADLGGASSGNYCATIGGAEAATTPASKSYLQGAWNGSATYDKDPQARLSFGVFGGQPNQIIFMRERY